ncbi:hypothetical protein FE783_19400 [Paenibacillus mesophilus]|uniref:hypothetical protein n=1 Tax=Paenibacillus mesophilus TaxID=2582849 RepID=UPI00110E591F|nr:hypothetical protein [Paenibacillus mesophilus]TMV48120.1 hypothetical protein FE783_19400 [Paenibacillus mesophilus]
MAEMTNDILMLAAVVTSYVGILKAYGVPSKHNHLFSLAIAAVFVLVSDHIQQILLTVSLVGLTASGAYHYSKGQNRNGDREDADTK